MDKGELGTSGGRQVTVDKTEVDCRTGGLSLKEPLPTSIEFYEAMRRYKAEIREYQR